MKKYIMPRTEVIQIETGRSIMIGSITVEDNQQLNGFDTKIHEDENPRPQYAPNNMWDNIW